MLYDHEDILKPGRPSSFTKKKAEKIIEAVKQGATYKQAAACGGISYSTMNRWRNAGESVTAPKQLETFCRQLDEANGHAALKLIGCINTAAENDWKAASWMLERRFPQEWGKNGKADYDPNNPFD